MQIRRHPWWTFSVIFSIFLLSSRNIRILIKFFKSNHYYFPSDVVSNMVHALRIGGAHTAEQGSHLVSFDALLDFLNFALSQHLQTPFPSFPSTHSPSESIFVLISCPKQFTSQSHRVHDEVCQKKHIGKGKEKINWGDLRKDDETRGASEAEDRSVSSLVCF